MSRPPDGTFTFSTPLRKTPNYGLYWISIPRPVSRAIGLRGPVPVVAMINGETEVRASIVPVGDGRHRLQLNARVRAAAGVALRDRIDVILRVDDDPQVDPAPPDLEEALAENGVREAYEQLPPGLKRHLLEYVEQAVAERTREKRIAQTVEVALRRSEAAKDRAARSRKTPRG